MFRNKPYLVGISGGSGCGKTTVLNALFDSMPTGNISLISQDNYYLDITKQPKDENGIENFDTPESFKREELIADIVSLSQGQKVTLNEYTFNNSNAVSSVVEILPAPIVLIEGLFVFHFTEINSLLNYKVFIDTDEDIRLNRRIKRDWTERGYPEDQVRYQWEKHVMPAYNKYLKPYVADCDLIINNNDHYESDLMKLTEHLNQIS